MVDIDGINGPGKRAGVNDTGWLVEDELVE